MSGELLKNCELAVIGGGPAGMAAALSARKQGIRDIVIIERENKLGGILNQCIHNGFGLHTFKEELTGPEYAYRYSSQVEEEGISCLLDTTVLDITSEKVITAVNGSEGLIKIRAGAIVLAMGCRERPRGALNIPGMRPAGIYSAGTAQKLINIYGLNIGSEAVILGSGDIGLIMARRLTLEGAKVKCVCEIMPEPGGLRRNIAQCLGDFGIPLKLSHTIVNIYGKKRIEGVSIAEVDGRMKPIPGTEEYIPCDTLLLSVGLIPENELSLSCGVKLDRATKGPEVSECYETNIPGIFACGNVLQVHDLVDNVSAEAEFAGRHAAEYFIKNRDEKGKNAGFYGVSDHGHMPGPKAAYARDDGMIPVLPRESIRYVLPQHISRDAEGELVFSFRVRTAIKGAGAALYADGRRIAYRKKRIMVPGEMQWIILTQKELESIDLADTEQMWIDIE